MNYGISITKDILESDLICIYKRWFIKVSKVDKDFSVSYMSDIELQVRLYNTHVNKVFFTALSDHIWIFCSWRNLIW